MQHAVKEFALICQSGKPATTDELQTALADAGWEVFAA
jgi:hypothetical protein